MACCCCPRSGGLQYFLVVGPFVAHEQRAVLLSPPHLDVVVLLLLLLREGGVGGYKYHRSGGGSAMPATSALQVYPCRWAVTHDRAGFGPRPRWRTNYNICIMQVCCWSCWWFLGFVLLEQDVTASLGTHRTTCLQQHRASW